MTFVTEEYIILNVAGDKSAANVRLAQLDRAFGYGPKGREFESSNAHKTLENTMFLRVFLLLKKENAQMYRYCKKCLLRDQMEKENEFETIRTYLDNLEPDIKASEEEYETRLEICKGCEMLLEAMCRSCGCYVEIRAAIGNNNCPRKKW